jgi:ligand-binding sensor domain-containing protein/AraC-like DNA-binding protein
MRFVVIILLSAFMVNPLLSKDSYHFTHFDQSNSALPYNSVKTVFSDSRGYVWIGTHNGLCRFNGSFMQNFNAEEIGCRNDYINSIAEDSNGNIWIGTDSGVTVYRYGKNNFVPFSSNVIPSERVFSIVKAPIGDMFVSVRNSGVYKRSVLDKSWKLITATPLNNVFKLDVVPDGRIILANYCDNLYISDGKGFVPLCADLFKGDYIGGIAVMDTTFVYVASKKYGLCRVNLSTCQSEAILDFGTGRPNNLRISGNSLLVTTSEGLLIYDTSDGTSEYITSSYTDPHSLSSKYVSDACMDSCDGLWVATSVGINYSSPISKIIHRLTSLNSGEFIIGSMVTSFVQDDSGIIWVGTEHMGLLRFDPESQILSKYTINNSIPVCINAMCIYKGCLWLGSSDGVFRMSLEDGAVAHYNELDRGGNFDNRIISLFVSNDGTLYAGATIGLCVYNREEDRFYGIESMTGVNVGDMRQIREDEIWMATYAHGVVCYQPSDGKVNMYPSLTGSVPSNLISSLCVDSDDNLWVLGYKSGLFRKMKIGFERVDKKNYIGTGTEIYFSAISDSRGFLWVGTDKGLICFNPKDKSFYSFTEVDGLINNKFGKACLHSKNDMLAFGTNDGIVIFNPAELLDAQKNFKLLVSEKGKKGAGLWILFAAFLIIISGTVVFFVHKSRKSSNPRKEIKAIDLKLENSDEAFIREFNKIILENIANYDFSVKDIEVALAMSHNPLNEKTKRLLGTTPNNYIRKKRLDAAAQAFKKGGVRVNEVCYAVGFNTPSYFSKCFQKEYGMSPTDYIKKTRAGK